MNRNNVVLLRHFVCVDFFSFLSVNSLTDHCVNHPPPTLSPRVYSLRYSLALRWVRCCILSKMASRMAWASLSFEKRNPAGQSWRKGGGGGGNKRVKHNLI